MGKVFDFSPILSIDEDRSFVCGSLKRNNKYINIYLYCFLRLTNSINSIPSDMTKFSLERE